MPFDDSFNPEEEQQQGQPQNPNGALAPSGGVISGAGKAGNSGTQTNSTSPTSSGSFTNLQSYLDANSGQNFGSQLAGNVQGQVDKANEAQNSANQQFKNDVDQNTVNYNPDLINSAISDPLKALNDSGTNSQIKSQLNAKYSGPMSLQTDPNNLYDPAYSQTQNAYQQAQEGQTEGGRFDLLNKYFGNPNYSQGQQNLDQFLVQADPNAAAGFQNASKGAQESLNNWNQSLASNQALATKAADSTNATGKQANDAFNTAINGNLTNYNNLVSQDQADQNAAYQKLQQQLTGATLPTNIRSGMGPGAQRLPSELSGLIAQYGIGLGPAVSETPYGGSTSSNNFWGINPAQYVSKNGTPNLSSVTTADQQAKLNALQSLAGQTPQAFDASIAGSYDPNAAVKFNNSGFDQAMKDAAGSYQTQADSLLGNIKSASESAGSTQQSQIPGLEGNISDYFGQLNAIRASLGLSPLTDPYNNLHGSPVRGGA